MTASFCRNCGKSLSDADKAIADNVLCAECRPIQSPTPATATLAAPPPGSPSAGLAFVLGLIPGVGAIYNGQYGKGLIHVFIFGMLISIASSPYAGGLEPVLVMMTIAWVPYMAFEAYHTALRRERSQPVDEFSSLIALREGSLGLPIALIVAGVVFLLENLEILRIGQVLRFWPVGLIGLGLYLLYRRLAPADGTPIGGEAHHEQQ